MQRYSDAQALKGEEDRVYADYRKNVLDESGYKRLVQKVREQRQDFTRQLERAQLMNSDTGMSTVKSILWGYQCGFVVERTYTFRSQATTE